MKITHLSEKYDQFNEARRELQIQMGYIQLLVIRILIDSIRSKEYLNYSRNRNCYKQSEFFASRIVMVLELKIVLFRNTISLNVSKLRID